jgi:hypothetical protein
MEWHIHTGSGLFFYSGEGVVKEQHVSSGRFVSDYTSPYGKKPGFSWVGGVSFRKPLRHNLLWGATLEYQSFRVMSAITGVFSGSPQPTIPSSSGPASGTSELNAGFIALYPFFGKRLAIGKTTLDITAGPEMAFAISQKRKLDYATSTAEYHDEIEMTAYYPIEVRAQLQVKLQVKRFGIAAGYTRGLSNSSDIWKTDFTYSDPTYSNFIRLNLFYKLR